MRSEVKIQTYYKRYEIKSHSYDVKHHNYDRKLLHKNLETTTKSQLIKSKQ